MGFWSWVTLFFIACIAIAAIQIMTTNKKKSEMESRINTLPGFKPSQQVMGVDGASGLAFDELSKKICIIKNSGTSVTQRVIDYKDIISVELFEDGSSVTKTVRSSQIGGAVVGGLLLGGVGAVIGGLSGTTETSGKIKRIDLRLVVNDTSAPLHDIAFMNVEGKKGGLIYNLAIQSARQWHGIVEVLIKRADSEDRNADSVEKEYAATQPNASVADEIKKLADLRDSGLLTPDEFQTEKMRLLSRDRGAG